MESFFSRYRNPMILGMVLLLQVFGLAVQVKRPVDPRHPEAGSVRMIRLWVFRHDHAARARIRRNRKLDGAELA